MAEIAIRPFSVSFPESALEDLRLRLRSCRWPEKETVDDWSQGVPLQTLQELCSYWQEGYNWRHCEEWLNKQDQFVAEIDGEQIHFLHIRSSHGHALPILLLHGWPGSILEFRDVIEPLSEPTNYGGRAEDAFHLVIPSMPGYGFSSRPSKSGTNFRRMASLYTRLMEKLEYEHWVAQGGDWGADICAVLASQSPPKSLAGIHLNCLFIDAHKESKGSTHLSPEEQMALMKQMHFEAEEEGYFKQQATRPQTIGYSLTDSPVGQAAWIYEKLHTWANHDGDLFTVLSKDQVLDNITLYWLTNTGASSARLYWEEKADDTSLPISIPVGVTQFPDELTFAPKHWAERYYSNIIHWEMAERGGHFAAWEVPDIFVREIRDCFRSVRGQ